jgi:hypothetical protein
MRQRNYRDERGTVLIQVGLWLGALVLMCALALDYGMLLIGRSQIQNAADGAALAAATALAFDKWERSSDAPAGDAARSVAALNEVASEEPNVTEDDITFPLCPDSFAYGPSVPPNLACVRVDAYRTAERGNPLLNFFASAFGVASSGVAATATAQARAANATPCLAPLAIPDRWQEFSPTAGSWGAASTFAKWTPLNTLLVPADFYWPPDPFASGPGLSMADVGTQVVLHHGTIGSASTPWHYLPVEIPGSSSGNYQDNVEQCADSLVTIGDRLPLRAGNFDAMTAAGMQALIDRDSGAYWNDLFDRVDGSCADAAPACAALSPRVVAVALYDPEDMADQNLSGATNVLVRNIVGLFVESVDATSVSGYLTRYPGLIDENQTVPIDASSFLRKVILVPPFAD